MTRMGKARTSSYKRSPMPPSPKMAKVRPVKSCVLAAMPAGFHFRARRNRSAMEYCRTVEIRRYKAVVAVASSTAPGVLERYIPSYKI